MTRNPTTGRTIGSSKRVHVIGDSISLHYGPYLEEYLPDGLIYARKLAEPELEARQFSAGGALEYSTVATQDAGSRSRLLDYPEGPFGENAGDSGMVLAYLQAGSPAVAAADIVLLNCGLHDLKMSRATGLRQVEPDVYREHLEGIVALLAAAAKSLLWVTTTPVDDATHEHHGATLTFRRSQLDVERYNQVAADVMRGAGVPLIDLHDYTMDLAAGGVGLAALYVDHVHFTPTVRAAQARFLAERLRRAAL